MYCYLLHHHQSYPPSALLHHQSCNHIPCNLLVLMSPPSSCNAAALQHWCRHHFHCDAATAPMLPCYCCHTSSTTKLLLPPRCRVCRRVTTKLPPLPLPPRHHHRHHRRRRCQAATAATKLLLLLLSKEFYNMTDIEFVQLSWLFRLGIEFLHGGMLPIFDALDLQPYSHDFFSKISRTFFASRN